MAGFFYRKSLTGNSSGALLNVPLKNSEAVAKGDSVDWNDGFLEVSDAGDFVIGVLEGVRGGTASLNSSDAYTALSANQSMTRSATSQAMGQVNVEKDSIYYNDADSTLTQKQVGMYFDCVAAGDRIDQSSRSSSATKSFRCIARNPGGAGTRGDN